MMPQSASSPPANEVTPGLYLVATPIGNLRDITLRALDVLSGVDVVLAEDTRVAGKLLAAHGIKARLRRYDEHAAARARPGILSDLVAGAAVALISDAGTPLISDPGYRLAREAAEQGTAVIPVPGPSATLAALSVAGLPTDRFLFAGFPPPKSGGRRALFEELAHVRATLIFFEGGSRLADSLGDMAAVFGARDAAVARELTKLHETVVRGPLDILAADHRFVAPKGEIVVLVGPGDEVQATPETADAALTEALVRVGPAEAATEVAKALGLPRRGLYARALALRDR
jgi:16S rRNA (cytidine1402-2'-O)-methyltransferase